MTAIEQLLIQAVVTLSDETAIVAARAAYDNLSVSQKSLVTNLSKLTDAEAALATLDTF
jgi:3',5'-cyclic AMP phosphodiesterase CpdA